MYSSNAPLKEIVPVSSKVLVPKGILYFTILAYLLVLYILLAFNTYFSFFEFSLPTC